MNPVYFDVSDVVKFAISNPRVTGIQRVQLNLIAQITRQYPDDPIQCIFLDPKSRKICAFDPRGVIDESFDTGLMLRRLGVIAPNSPIPEPWQVKRALRAYDRRKVLRALHKVSIHLTARFAPARLAKRGLQAPSAQERAVSRVQIERIDTLPAQATLVLLGANWRAPRLEAFALEHARRGDQVIQLIYDLIPVVAPQFFGKRLKQDFEQWLTTISAAPRSFICISDCTASDLRRYLGSKAKRTDCFTVPLAHEMLGFGRTENVSIGPGAALDASARPYVLCVGTIEIRKNGKALLDAWAALYEQLGERLPRLVFAGRMGWLIDEFNARLAGSEALSRTVCLVESPSDLELAFLYQNCLFTAYPSLYEGWGLPVGEAAWFGKYCVSSNTSSLPEVCGDLIDYVDPTDSAELQAALKLAITQPDYVAQREKIIRETRLRTWSDVANDLYQCVRTPGRVSLPQTPPLQSAPAQRTAADE
jgi:glycosyltransferase involved in cell wall biosynthesis